MPYFDQLKIFWSILELESVALQNIKQGLYRQAISTLRLILNRNQKYSHAYYLYSFCLFHMKASGRLFKQLKEQAKQINCGCELFDWTFGKEVIDHFIKIIEEVNEQKELLSKQEVASKINNCFENIEMVYHKFKDFHTSSLVISGFFTANQLGVLKGKPNSDRVDVVKNHAVEITQGLYHSGRHKEHLQFLNCHLHLQDNNPRKYTNRAVLLYLNKDLEGMRTVLDEGLGQHSDFYRIRYLMSFYFISQGNFLYSKNMLRIAIEKNPKALVYIIESIIVSYMDPSTPMRYKKAQIVQQILDCIAIMDKKEDSEYTFIPETLYPQVKQILNTLELYLKQDKVSIEANGYMSLCLQCFRMIALLGWNLKIKALQKALKYCRKVGRVLKGEQDDKKNMSH